MGFPGGSEVKASAWNVGDLGSVPGMGRSHEEGNSYSFQYSDLEKSMESQRVSLALLCLLNSRLNKIEILSSIIVESLK